MRLRLAVLAAALLLCGSARAAKILTIVEVIQDHDQWCWAATSRSALLFFGVDQPQCAIAEYTRTVSTEVLLGPAACCTDWNQGCNHYNVFWLAPGSIEDIAKHFANAQTTTVDGRMSLADIAAAVNADKLFFILWIWSDGTGHFLLGHGYDGSLVYFLNPWPGEGLQFGEYTWMVNNAEHDWQNALLVSAPTACSNKPEGALCDDANACTLDDTCHSGICTGTAKDCSASATCRESAGCDPGTGTCLVGAAVADGTACDDSNKCTDSDRCQSGVCHGTAKACAAPDSCHEAGTCDPATGGCTLKPKADGATCPEGKCKAGSCQKDGTGQPPPSGLGCSAAGAGLALPLALATAFAWRRRRRTR
jgi:uncharacterized protein (TIGR03382 family)